MKKEILIGNKKIGLKNPIYIIAEIGSNHNNDLKIAKKMIDEAANAGVDAVKFQSFKAENLYSRFTPKFSKDKIKPFDLIKSIEIPYTWHKELYIYSKSRDLQFLSSPFDFEAVDSLCKVGVPAFKISSFEIVDHELISYIAKKRRPIILSTGMANVKEIREALDVIISQNNDEVILLHCNSVYPTPAEIVNLNAIQNMFKIFKIPIGFSDHTLGIHIPVAAVAKGAKVIEKHFTLDRKMKGPDHSFSIEPTELKQMVKNIRDIEKAEGDGIKERSALEDEMYKKGRRSIIAAKKIPQDTKITRDMLIIKRPGYGIEPKLLPMVIGCTAKHDIKADQWITFEDINYP